MLKHRQAITGPVFTLDQSRERAKETHNEHGQHRELRGLGDVVERITTATGMKAVVEYVNGGPCRGCAQRQQNLNEAFPFGSEK